MSNALSRLLDLLPKTPEFIATVQSADHPNYKVLVVDGTGLVLCTSSTVFSVHVSTWDINGWRLFFSALPSIQTLNCLLIFRSWPLFREAPVWLFAVLP